MRVRLAPAKAQARSADADSVQLSDRPAPFWKETSTVPPVLAARIPFGIAPEHRARMPACQCPGSVDTSGRDARSMRRRPLDTPRTERDHFDLVLSLSWR